jgi:hypothetical protein
MSDWRNITVSVRWETYYYAREWAAQQDMSISAVVNRFLDNLPYRRDYKLPPPRPRVQAELPAKLPTPTENLSEIFDALGITDEE